MGQAFRSGSRLSRMFPVPGRSLAIRLAPRVANCPVLRSEAVCEQRFSVVLATGRRRRMRNPLDYAPLPTGGAKLPLPPPELPADCRSFLTGRNLRVELRVQELKRRHAVPPVVANAVPVRCSPEFFDRRNGDLSTTVIASTPYREAGNIRGRILHHVGTFAKEEREYCHQQ